MHLQMFDNIPQTVLMINKLHCIKIRVFCFLSQYCNVIYFVLKSFVSNKADRSRVIKIHINQLWLLIAK